MNNKGKNFSQKMIVELYTPVHVGSGQELQSDFDFFPVENKNNQQSLFVVDVEQTLKSIKIENNDKLNEYYQHAQIKDLVEIAGKEKYGYSLQLVSNDTRTIAVNIAVNQTNKAVDSNRQRSSRNTIDPSRIRIREYLKDAFFRPYIPGSSLKGAIRTALWAEVLSQENQDKNRSKITKKFKKYLENPRNFKKDESFEANIFSATEHTEPKKDIMRALCVSDGYFEKNALYFGDIRVANVCDNKIKWSNLSYKTNKNKSRWEEAKGIYVELLNKSAKAEFIFSYDDFLLSDCSDWCETGSQSSQTDAGQCDDSRTYISDIFKAPDQSSEKKIKFSSRFQQLKKILNEHALRVIENEKIFFSAYKEYECKKVLDFYKTLESEIKKDDVAYVRLAWGSGWTGMTGLTKECLDDELKKSADGIQKIYPKTRKLLVSNSAPSLPLGWVKIYPSDGSVQNPYRKMGAIPEAPKSQQQFSSWLSKQISTLCKKHTIKEEGEVLRGRHLAKAWQELPEGEEKKERLEEIKNYWKKEGWWDAPSGRTQKKVKAIYEGSDV